MLAETEYRHQIEADLQPFRGFLLGLFFITVGMGIDPALIGSEALRLTAILAALILVKAAVVFVLARLFRLPWRTALQSGLLLAQGGEFAFVLFAIAEQTQILAKEESDLLVLAVSISMVLMPLLAALGDRLTKHVPKGLDSAALPAGMEELEGHIVIAGFGRVGQSIAKLLDMRSIAYAALDLDADRVAAMRKRDLPVFFADASQPQVLHVIGVARARAIVVTIDQPDRAEQVIAVMQQLYPDIPVFARARDRAHGAKLRGVGADIVMQETAESSLQLGAALLRAVGVEAEIISEMVEKVREDDYAILDRRSPSRSG
jgi:CPA2 family monovalent cation:H+ antiporter-2